MISITKIKSISYEFLFLTNPDLFLTNPDLFLTNPDFTSYKPRLIKLYS